MLVHRMMGSKDALKKVLITSVKFTDKNKHILQYFPYMMRLFFFFKVKIEIKRKLSERWFAVLNFRDYGVCAVYLAYHILLIQIYRQNIQSLQSS